MRFHTGFHPIRPLSIPLFFLLLFLVSCSGSGSDTGTNPPPDQAPVATATTVTEADWVGTDIPRNPDPGSWTARYTLSGSQIGSQVSISRVITWAGVDCRATLNLGTWYGNSFLQVGFAP